MDYSKLTNDELKALKAEKEIEISKSHNMQLAKKILLNSCYGAMSNPFFLYYSDILAESITLSGQLSIQWVSKYINLYINKILKTVDVDYIIANDTDSCYVDLNPIVETIAADKDVLEKVEFVDKFCKTKMAEVIAEAYSDLAKMMNAYSQKMRMKRENIADIAIWTAKKRYIMNVWDSEGVRYKEPKVKIVGIDAVRSSTPYVVREYIKEAIKNFIVKNDEDGLQKYIKECRENFSKLRFEDVGKPTGVKGLSDYSDKFTLYKKGTPAHVKASLIYNKIIKEKGLENKFPLITEGDKIKWCNLKTPNPIREKTLAVSTVLPSQLQLEQYIDYDAQFEITFLSPLKKILDAIGWRTEKIETLESFFM